MKTSTSSSHTVLLLFFLLLPCLHARCPSKCDNGNIINGCKCSRHCSGEIYWYLRQGQKICEHCTPRCSADYNLIEVTPCTLDHNRVCKCKPGFYCSRENNYTTYCHKPCVPCASGTFSSTPSLSPSCTPHTDCAKNGKEMLEEGTTTKDRKCGHSTTPTLTTMTTPTLYKTITTLSSTTARTPSSSATMNPTKPTSILNTLLMSQLSHNFKQYKATQTYLLTLQSTAEVTSAPSFIANTGDSMPKERLLLVIMLLILLLVMAAFCTLRKSTAKKTLSKCTGFIPGRHKDTDQWLSKADHQISSNSKTLTEHSQSEEAKSPQDSDVRGHNVGVMPHSGAGQQVSMENNVKGENISNTVGSIYIYSPGMVIVGSNNGDKKEEAGVCEEGVPLLSTPQQESTPQSQEGNISMSAQEEELSLSFPVPATGK